MKRWTEKHELKGQVYRHGGKEPAQSPINHSMLHPLLTAYWAREDREDMAPQKYTGTPFIPPSVSFPLTETRWRQSRALFVI